MNGTITTPRLALVPLTTGNISFFLDDMPRFERETGLLYSGGELEFLNRPYLEKLKQELSDDPENQLLTTEYLISLRDGGRVIGCMDYKYLPRDGVTEVGYGLPRFRRFRRDPHRARGYAPGQYKITERA